MAGTANRSGPELAAKPPSTLLRGRYATGGRESASNPGVLSSPLCHDHVARSDGKKIQDNYTQMHRPLGRVRL